MSGSKAKRTQCLFLTFLYIFIFYMNYKSYPFTVSCIFVDTYLESHEEITYYLGINSNFRRYS